MKTIFVKDYDEMSTEAYKIIEEVINENTEPVLSLNTGGTPRGLYKKLVKGINNGLNIDNTKIFSLDEYIGPKDAPYSVRRYMQENFLNLIDRQPKEVFLIDSETEDPREEIKRYKKLLSRNKVDLQLLGLGTNGHIGANEPGTPFDSTMFLAKHTESTIESTMKEYNISSEETPTEMLTLGFTEILSAKQILLLVSGAHKAKAVKALLEGDVTTDVPVTALKNHSDVTVIIDKEAASLLENNR